MPVTSRFFTTRLFTSRVRTRTTPRSLALLGAAALILTACGSTATTTAASSATTAADSGASASVSGPLSDTSSAGAAANAAANAASTAAASVEVTLVTHNDFAVDPAVLADFEASSGITIVQLAQEALPNQLVLTKDNPLGDVAFGVDNTFASRTVDAGVFEPYESPLAAGGSDRFSFDDAHHLTAVDFGDVCVNVDHTWFAAKGLAEPVTFDDLLKPEYRDLLVVESPATSTTGLAFLLGTIGHAGEQGWSGYWAGLKSNGVKVVAGWSDAYYVDFSGSDGKGDRPLVVSYASSPPAEVRDGMTEAPTGTLLDTCFRQIEYAGVLAGAKNPAAARQVVDFLLSEPFQAGLPESMYVYPVNASTPLPADWAKYATVAPSPEVVDPSAISANREQWIQDWSDLMQG